MGGCRNCRGRADRWRGGGKVEGCEFGRVGFSTG